MSGRTRARSPKHAAQVLRRMELDVFPRIGATPITSVRAPDVVALAKAVEARGAHDLARRAIQISGQVFRYAIPCITLGKPARPKHTSMPTSKMEGQTMG